MKTQFITSLYWYLLLGIVILSLPIQVKAKGNIRIKNFQAAKKVITGIYNKRPETFYCGCHYSGKTVDLRSCGFTSRNNSKLSKRIEWEHIVPAHAFGKNFKEWGEGHPLCKTKKGKYYKGRRCVTKIYPEFKRMEADLYNLVPAIGELNRARSDYSMSLIKGEERRYGVCDIEIKNRAVEPTENIRGDIARTYLYMDWAYPDRDIISQKNRELFQVWNQQDPVDQWECQKATMIFKVQGNLNAFVANSCSKLVAQ